MRRRESYGWQSAADGIWMLFGLLGLALGLLMTLTALCLQKKNREYRDALIDLSERLPGEEAPADGCKPEEAQPAGREEA